MDRYATRRDRLWETQNRREEWASDGDARTRLRSVQGIPRAARLPRHRPEATLLYQIVAEHYPDFRAERAAEGRPLPRYVDEEFEAYLKCGRLEHGFLRVRCEPGDHHQVSQNASTTAPAKLLAIFVVDTSDREIVIPDK